VPKKEKGMSWDDTQASFSRGADNQTSGSPLTFLDTATCDDILADIRQPDGTLPDFGSIPSEPGTPPPELEREVTHIDRETQTDHAPTQERGTQAISRPHQWSSGTQTTALASTADQATQVLLRPRQSWAFTQTERSATSSHTTSFTQTARPAMTHRGTGMPQVLTTSIACQAGASFVPHCPGHTPMPNLIPSSPPIPTSTLMIL